MQYQNKSLHCDVRHNLSILLVSEFRHHPALSSELASFLPRQPSQAASDVASEAFVVKRTMKLSMQT